MRCIVSSPWWRSSSVWGSRLYLRHVPVLFDRGLRFVGGWGGGGCVSTSAENGGWRLRASTASTCRPHPTVVSLGEALETNDGKLSACEDHFNVEDLSGLINTAHVGHVASCTLNTYEDLPDRSSSSSSRMGLCGDAEGLQLRITIVT